MATAGVGSALVLGTTKSPVSQAASALHYGLNAAHLSGTASCCPLTAHIVTATATWLHLRSPISSLLDSLNTHSRQLHLWLSHNLQLRVYAAFPHVNIRAELLLLLCAASTQYLPSVSDKLMACH